MQIPSFFSPTFFRNRYDSYQQLRESGPLVWTEELYGGAWLVTRHDDVLTAMRDPRLSAERADVLVAQFPPEQAAELRQFASIFGAWMLNIDPPKHTYIRSALNHLFKASTIETLRPPIVQLTRQLIGELERSIEVHGEADFVACFARQLPMAVISEMLGADEGDYSRFLEWSDAIAHFLGAAPTMEAALDAQRALVDICDYFRERIGSQEIAKSALAALAASPGVAEADAREMLLAQISVLLFAGYEPTCNLLGTGLHKLLTDSQAGKPIDGSLTSTVRELARYDSPVQMMGRMVAKDFEWHGKALKAGQLVLCLVGSANHDPSKFAHPEQLQFDRKETSSIALGYGAHSCIGARLAYLQAEIAFEELMRVSPKLKLVDATPDWLQTPLFCGLQSLRVTQA